jgi:hypothetical protein
MAAGHTRIEWQTVRALVVVFDPLNRLEEILDEA